MESTKIMAKSGDVMLKFGREDEITTDVLVSSGALGLASPVFEAMFSDRFLEGQTLSANSPREIPLPDDDPNSMLLICMIAHLRTAELPKKLEPIAFADFAVACDKYQCTEAVQAWSKVWLVALLKSPSSADFEKVLFATYVLDLPQEFNTASLVFIRDRSANIKIQHATHGHDFLPSILFDKLLSEKRRCEESAYQAIHTAISGFGDCEGSLRVIGFTIVSLRTAKVWPLGIASINQMKSRINTMDPIEDPDCMMMPNCDTCSPFPNIKASLTTAMNRVYKSTKGLCLDCIKREVCGDTRVCRVSHPDAVTASS